MGRQRAAQMEKELKARRAEAALAPVKPDAKIEIDAEVKALTEARDVERIEIPKGLNVSHVRFLGAIQVCGVPKEDMDAKKRGVTMTLAGGLLYVEQITALGNPVNGRQKMKREVAAVPITSVRVISFPPEIYAEKVGGGE